MPLMRSKHLTRATALALVSALAAACGGDDEAPAAPRPTPTLAVSSLSSAGGPTWTPESGDCVAVGADPAGTVVVSIAVEHFTLRPPGACGGIRPCGTAVLFVDESQVDQSSSQALAASFSGGDGGLAPGEHTFRVELRDHLGDVVLAPDDRVISDEVVVVVAGPGGCGSADAGVDAAPDAGDGGSDAAPDAPLDGSPDAPLDAPPDAPSDSPADASDGGVVDASDAAQD